MKTLTTISPEQILETIRPATRTAYREWIEAAELANRLNFSVTALNFS